MDTGVLVKTRQDLFPLVKWEIVQEQARKKKDIPQGMLHRVEGQTKFQLSRYEPSIELAFFVEHHWMVTWDLQEQEPYRQDILPHPSMHLTFGEDQTQVYGVVKRKFSYWLRGQGCIVAVKFHAGGFYPFVQTPVSAFTNRVFGLQEVLGLEGLLWKKGELSRLTDEEKIARVEAFLYQRLPAQDSNVSLVRSLVARIAADRDLRRVEDVAESASMPMRFLQRLFERYVGVSPKWVIQIYRLQQAAERVAQGGPVEWAELALDLGYTDQAHFIRHFKAIIGCSPTEYVARAQRIT